MWRNSLNLLSNWVKSQGRKPLILRGARQVGKSTLVREFCKSEQIQLLEINFEIESLKSMQKLEGLDLELVLEEIQARTKKTLKHGPSLIFFDEIQHSPVALAALRYFFEKKPELAVIAAGSLLEFLLDDHAFSMPVGRVDYLHIGPMTFYEFLKAMGEDQLCELLDTEEPKRWLNLHDRFSKRLREYYFVGGMPQAVLTYTETRDAEKTRQIHRSIIHTYKNDFSKYKNRISSDKMDLFFEKLPNFIGKKVKYSEFSQSDKSTVVAKVLRLFAQARLIHFCYHTEGSRLPLSALRSEDVYKIYFLDIGLYHYMIGYEFAELQLQGVESELIQQGESAEQFVAQHLAYLPTPYESPNLFYWLRNKKRDNAELDFLISKGALIIPVEVKSGKSGKLKSLINFIGAHSNSNLHKKAVRFDLKLREPDKLSGRDPVLDFDLINLPLYAVEKIYKILEKN